MGDLMDGDVYREFGVATLPCNTRFFAEVTFGHSAGSTPEAGIKTTPYG